MLIVSGDEIFSRMVQILLEDAGYTKISTTTQKKGPFERAIVDIDYAPSAVLSDLCISVSQSKGVGADLTRPFLCGELIELVERVFGAPDVESAMRNTKAALPTIDESDIELPIPGDELTLILGERSVTLSPKEYELYTMLYDARGKVLKRNAIAERVFDGAIGNDVEVYISYLRKKLSELTDRSIISTVRGEGYTIKCQRS